MSKHESTTVQNDEQKMLGSIYTLLCEVLTRVSKLEQSQGWVQATDPDDRWVTGYIGLRDALRETTSVSVDFLKKLRYAGILGISNDEEDGGTEGLDIGSRDKPRFKFHVGRSKKAIIRFESLPVYEKKRILTTNR